MQSDVAYNFAWSQAKISRAVGLGLLALAALSTTNAAHGADVKRYFQSLDRNGDGRLTREEYTRYPALAKHVPEADDNGNGAIEEDEFEALLLLITEE